MSDTTDIQPVTPKRKRRFPKRLLMILVPVLLVLAGGYLWLVSGRYASTDNAYVQQNMVAVVTEVSGKITDVGVKENQHVGVGDLLFRIDPQPYSIALQQSEAAISSARLQVEQLRATFGQAQAELNNARENAAYAQTQFERAGKLLASGTTARATYEQAENTNQTARQQLANAEQAVVGALAALGGDANIANDKHPLVLQAIAQRDKARLDLQHTEIRAPSEGVISQTDRLQQGQYVQTGTSVLSLVETSGSWIEANFKETDLTRMKPGQAVRVELDAYPDADLKGTVESIGAGTGSEFSLLPAQNATGNWVKVVQRVPVRVALSAPSDLPLRAGLSASVRVDTGPTGALAAEAAVRP